MELTQEQLNEMIKEVVSAQIELMREKGEGYDGIVKVGGLDLKSTLQDMGIGYGMGGDGYLVLERGSIINTRTPQAPWVKLSPELEEWANGLKEFIKSKGTIVPKVLQESNDPEGGYLVPGEFEATLVQYDTEPAIVWPRATVWPMNSDKLGMPKLKQRPDEDESDFDHFAGVSFTWTDEGGQKEETEPDFEFLELIVHELSGYTEITNILLEDSAINLMNFLTGLFRRAYVWITDRVFIRGNGARQPLGIVPDPATLTVNRSTAGTVTYADLLSMDSKLPSVFDNGAVWFMSKKVINAFRGQVDGNGQPILQEFYMGPSSIEKGPVQYVLGYPVVRSDGKTYPLGTKGDVILGNWTWYYIGDRRRFTLDTSAHYKFRRNKTAIRVCGRLDGQAAFSEAFVVLDLIADGS